MDKRASSTHVNPASNGQLKCLSAGSTALHIMLHACLKEIHTFVCSKNTTQDVQCDHLLCNLSTADDLLTAVRRLCSNLGKPSAVGASSCCHFGDGVESRLYSSTTGGAGGATGPTRGIFAIRARQWAVAI